jgi:hypothetical protein
MRCLTAIFVLLLACQLLVGCTLGKKEWPQVQESEDTFTLSVMAAKRTDTCLLLTIGVSGAVSRLYRASIEHETVGDGEGQGCVGCPFVPREAAHFTRNQAAFDLQGNVLKLSLCNLEPGTLYRFRVAGKSELPSMPLTYTEIYVTTQ